MRTGPRPAPVPRSAFSGFRFPPDVIVLAVRWYLRFGLSYRDVEELLAQRGVVVDHVTVYRWVQRFTSLLADAARPCRHAPGDRWWVDETYVKVAGRWRYVPGDRPVRPGHRRVRVPTTRRDRGPPVLPAGDRQGEGHARRGNHRPGGDVPNCAGWPSGTPSWVTRAGCRRPRPPEGSWVCRRPCAALPRRVPFLESEPRQSPQGPGRTSWLSVRTCGGDGRSPAGGRTEQVSGADRAAAIARLGWFRASLPSVPSC
jgi:hypothetical protein